MHGGETGGPVGHELHGNHWPILLLQHNLNLVDIIQHDAEL
jgi:hypothetical protein